MKTVRAMNTYITHLTELLSGIMEIKRKQIIAMFSATISYIDELILNWILLVSV